MEEMKVERKVEGREEEWMEASTSLLATVILSSSAFKSVTPRISLTWGGRRRWREGGGVHGSRRGVKWEEWEWERRGRRKRSRVRRSRGR